MTDTTKNTISKEKLLDWRRHLGVVGYSVFVALALHVFTVWRGGLEQDGWCTVYSGAFPLTVAFVAVVFFGSMEILIFATYGYYQWRDGAGGEG